MTTSLSGPPLADKPWQSVTTPPPLPPGRGRYACGAALRPLEEARHLVARFETGGEACGTPWCAPSLRIRWKHTFVTRTRLRRAAGRARGARRFRLRTDSIAARTAPDRLMGKRRLAIDEMGGTNAYPMFERLVAAVLPRAHPRGKRGGSCKLLVTSPDLAAGAAFRLR